MYRREVDGQVLEFGHAGMLYEQSFVMYDKQTDSLWVHVTGRAEAGPLKGKRLRLVPSTVTTWEAWKASYPHTRVLTGSRTGIVMGNYMGIHGSAEIGLAVTVRFHAKLYPYEVLQRRKLVNDSVHGTAVVVYFGRERGTATAWNRTLDGRTLTFARSERVTARGQRLMRDAETGSLWSWLTGEAVAGPLQGRRLEQLLYNPILVRRFAAFYPDGAIYSGG